MPVEVTQVIHTVRGTGRALVGGSPAKELVMMGSGPVSSSDQSDEHGKAAKPETRAGRGPRGKRAGLAEGWTLSRDQGEHVSSGSWGTDWRSRLGGDQDQGPWGQDKS